MEINDFFNSLTPDVIAEVNRLQIEAQEKEFNEFIANFKNDRCYLCSKELADVGTSLCLHNLLFRANPKKGILERTFEKHGLFPTLTYLAWVANSEATGINIQKKIHNLETGKKFECSFKWQNIVWSFSVAESDFQGHSGTQTDFPHFHVEILINEKFNTRFGQLHLRLTDQDIFNLKAIDFFKDRSVLFSGHAVDSDALEESFTASGGSILAPVIDNQSPHYHVESVIRKADGSSISQAELDELISRSTENHKLIFECAKEKGYLVQSAISPTDAVLTLRERK
ncbi:MAG: hypothetical protein H6686_09095 [Fibrobacteria bacterium]|nr:hypothetical protein [Fibrobacteria bacterium]